MGPYLAVSFSAMALSYYERQGQITEQRDHSTMGGDGYHRLLLRYLSVSSANWGRVGVGQMGRK